MIREISVHEFPFEPDESGLYDNIETFCTPCIDICVILTLIKKFNPKSLLEIGTHKGYTTRNIKRKFSSLNITTVDPGDKIRPRKRPEIQKTEYLPQHEIGSLLIDYPDIKIIKDAFENIDFKGEKFDFIFIDGNHDHDNIINDTKLALNLINRPGIIVWHDFNHLKTVNDAVATFDQLSVINLPETWVGYCEVP